MSAKKALEAQEEELLNLKLKKEEMTDVYPNSELTLRVSNENFDGSKWFDDVCELDIQIREQEEITESYRDQYKHWFSEQVEPEKEEKK